jgi:hypothetical protein
MASKPSVFGASCAKRAEHLPRGLGLRETLSGDHPALLEAARPLEHRVDLLARALRGIEGDRQRQRLARRPVGHRERARATLGARGLGHEGRGLARERVGRADPPEIALDGRDAPLHLGHRFRQRAHQLLPA